MQKNNFPVGEQTIPFHLRRSARAKRPRLCITPVKGLEVVVPVRFNTVNIPDLLREHHAWIVKNLSKMPAREAQQALPDRIVLNAIEEEWQVRYVKSTLYQKPRVLLCLRPGNILELSGNREDKEACKAALIRWIRTKAQQWLSDCLLECSRTSGLRYQSFKLRGQTARWGSCSSTGSISLNYRLIFLPSALARHVILHELAHTRFLNHSEDFWGLLSSLDPDCQRHRRELRLHLEKGWVPAWLMG